MGAGHRPALVKAFLEQALEAATKHAEGHSRVRKGRQ